MKLSVAQQELSYFLEDFTQNSISELVEGSEKSDLEKVAEAQGYKAKSLDLGLFKTIYAFTNKPNSNGAILPEKKLLKVLPRIIGKPININHSRTKVVGHYIDYKYIQKDRKIIAYGAFYKSYYPEEWAKAKELFKKGKLSTSFEIWSPREARVDFEDGTYALGQMEIAGGALIYENKDNIPAFKDAKALALAKKVKTPELELVLAKYDQDHKEAEIITSENVNTQALPLSKVTCTNCNKVTDMNPHFTLNKCVHCKALIDPTGKMVYPPQIKSWSLLCPGCKVDNWIIIAQNNDETKIKCSQCQKVYIAEFSKLKDFTAKFLAGKIVYDKTISCIQCKKPVRVMNLATMKNREITCSKCGIVFPLNISNLYKKTQIKTIRLVEPNLAKSSKQGGKQMIEIAKFHRYIETDDFLEYAKTLFEDESEQLEEAQKLSDSDYAVIVRVKDKKTGELKKIRKLPIMDEAHVEKALKKLDKETLEKLGVSSNSVKRRVYKKAKALDMVNLLIKNEEEAEKLGISMPKVKAVKAMETEILEALPETVATCVRGKEGKTMTEAVKECWLDYEKATEAKVEEAKKEIEEKDSLVKAKDQELTLIKRKKELGETKLTDEEILDEEKYELEMAKKEKIKKHIAVDDFGGKPETAKDKQKEWLKGVDDQAFGHQKKNK